MIMKNKNKDTNNKTKFKNKKKTKKNMNKTKKIRTIESNAKTSARSRTRFSCVIRWPFSFKLL